MSADRPNHPNQPASAMVRDSAHVLQALTKAAEIARLRRELWARINNAATNGRPNT